MTIVIIRLSYSGLAKGVCLSNVGIEVTFVDIIHKSVLLNEINAYFSDNLHGKAIAFLGLSFKPNTDEIREAPSILLANLLTVAAENFRAYDPVATEEAKYNLGDTINYCQSYMEAVQSEDALALISEWTEFPVPNWKKIGTVMKTKEIFYPHDLSSAA